MLQFQSSRVLYLVGVLTSIVLIGGFLVWIAWIFAAWGFTHLSHYRQPISIQLHQQLHHLF
jgi:uncharacterized membrane protein